MFQLDTTLSAFEDKDYAPLRHPLAADHVVYVYAFAEPRSPASQRETSDTAQAPSLYRVGAVSAIICYVPALEFSGPASEQRLADPGWVMPRIRHHETVVERIMEQSPVFPMPFATLFDSLDSLARFMRRHETTIAAFLRQITGQEEWALRITTALDDVTALDNMAGQLWPEWSHYPPGMRYLRLRQELPRLLDAARERAGLLIPRVVEELGPQTTAIRKLSRPTAVPDADQQHVENYALLVPIGQRAALCDRLSQLTKTWESERISFAMSGPWPSYSFRPLLHEGAPQRSG
jgi:hypothetical protein